MSNNLYECYIGENNPKLSKLVQEKLFDLGFDYRYQGSGCKKAKCLNKPYLYLYEYKSKGYISWSPEKIKSAKKVDIVHFLETGKLEKDLTLKLDKIKLTTKNKDIINFLVKKLEEKGFGSTYGSYINYEIHGVGIDMKHSEIYTSWAKKSVIQKKYTEVSLEKFLELIDNYKCYEKTETLLFKEWKKLEDNTYLTTLNGQELAVVAALSGMIGGNSRGFRKLTEQLFNTRRVSEELKLEIIGHITVKNDGCGDYLSCEKTIEEFEEELGK